MINDSLSSSHFALEGKRMGVDAIVLVGACSRPSVLINGKLEPTDLWGKSSEETEAALAKFGRVASIGVAGENCVKFATISNDGRHAGRGGMGAVMGAKKLKAIVVSGDIPTKLADPERVQEISRDLSRRSFGPAMEKYRELGSAAELLAFNRMASLPARNFQSGTGDAQQFSISVEQLAPAREKARKSCASCTIGCEQIYRFKDKKATRMEAQNLFALGPLCGISNPDDIFAASKRCDELGLDTISAGGTIAFAMECAERKLIDGPHFGDAAGVLVLLDDIAHRRNLGALLAEGSRRAAAQIGHDSIDFAPQVKGLEIPGYEPRVMQTMALGFAVGTRGADHNRSGAYELDFSEQVDRLKGTPEAARLAIEPENRAALIDSLILCKFLRGIFTDIYAESAEMLRAITGWDVTRDELEATSSRIVALKKAFNISEGWKPEDDTLPKRFLSEGLP